jgi:hypothetical protein
MTQANDLGNIGNQLAATYRTRVNTNIQALVTQHYGAAELAALPEHDLVLQRRRLYQGPQPD